MTNQLQRSKYWSIEISLAKLYLYLLPIRMIVQLSFLESAMHGAGRYLDVILHGIGIFLMVVRSKGILKIDSDYASRLMQYFVKMVIFFNASSIVMAVVIQYIYGDYAGEGAVSGILGMFFYFIQYTLMIFYNKQIFCMISKEEILKIMQRICFFLLILGYWQILALNFAGIFQTMIEKIDVLQVLYPGDSMPKLSLTMTEGAKAGNLVSIFVLPFLYSQMIMQTKKFRYLLQVFLWLPVLCFTSSSTAYILFVVITLFFMFLRLKNTNIAKNITVFFTAICIIMLLILVFPNFAISLLPDNTSQQIKYLLMYKIFDMQNGSTVLRLLPFHINFGAFCQFPVFGVGNGLQGYFFEKYVPSLFFTGGYYANSLYNDMLSSLSNGSLFFPSILSGYGIVGTIIFCIYVYRLLKLAFYKKKQLKSFYYMFIIAAVAVLISGFQSDFTGEYYLWFMMSLPYMANIPNQRNQWSKDVDVKKPYFNNSNDTLSSNTEGYLNTSCISLKNQNFLNNHEIIEL